MPKKRAPNLENALEELEMLVVQLERGDTSLEEALKLFEKGVSLSRHCQQALQEAEQKVDILMGEKVEPFPLPASQHDKQELPTEDTDDAIKNLDD